MRGHGVRVAHGTAAIVALPVGLGVKERPYAPRENKYVSQFRRKPDNPDEQPAQMCHQR